MTAKIYEFPSTPDVSVDEPEHGDGPDVIEIRIILKAPDMSDEPDEIEYDEPEKQRNWPWILGGALLGALLGG